MANEEALTLDGVEFHDGNPFFLVDVDLTPPKKTLQWARSANQDGATLIAPPFHELREIKATVQVKQQASMNLALDAIGTLVDKLQLAEQTAAGGLARGLALVYVPAGSTYTYTFYVKAGEVTGLPVTMSDGWLVRAPTFEVTMWCDPAGFGAEVTSAVTTSALPVIEKTLTGTAGDLAAEARLIVEDNAAQARDHVEWGCDQDTASTIVDSDALVTSGFAGTQTTRTGAYDVGGGNNVIRATLTTTPVVICGTGDLPHIGTYRIKCRGYASAAGVSVRLAWREGRDQFSRNPYAVPVAVGGFVEVDLGTVTVTNVVLGAQTWEGRVEAKATTPGTTFDVDVLWLVPATKGYGRARAVTSFDAPITFSARDEFDQTAGALAGKTLPVGGTWAGAGDADDLSVDATNHYATRSIGGDITVQRYEIAGSTTYTTSGVQVAFETPLFGGGAQHGVVSRYVDASNFLMACLRTGSAPNPIGAVVLAKTVAGVRTTIAQTDPDGFNSLPITENTRYTIRLVVLTDGRFYVWWTDSPTGPAGTPILQGKDTDLATGGTLASGKAGFTDYNPSISTHTRIYDDWFAWVPEIDHAMFSAQSIEFRAYGDACLREDSTGTYAGRPGEYTGGRFWLPTGTARVAVKPRRFDVESTVDGDNITDSTKVTVAHRPRWLVIPRSA